MNSAMITTKIGIRDFVVNADIGVYPHEIGTPQPLMISVELTIRSPLADRLSETFDYSEIVRIAKQLAGERIALIEIFASRLASACMVDPNVHAAAVSIKKPGAIPRGTAQASVSVIKGIKSKFELEL